MVMDSLENRADWKESKSRGARRWSIENLVSLGVICMRSGIKLCLNYS